MAIQILYKGKNLMDVDLQDMIPLGALQDLIAQQTLIERPYQKLVYKGKILRDDADLQSLSPNSKITLIGNPQSEEVASTTHPMINIRDDLSNSRESRPFNVSAKKLMKKPKVIHTNYKFHDVQVLPGLPMQDKAMQILQSLANDPAVLSILQAHEWSVGMLCELYPEGYVGVSDVCVLGLNENKGQRIKLRIRTDDLKGFRKMLTIKKVLFHELAHNVHSEHDNEFYMLMRQIEREYEEFDWGSKRGHRVGDGEVYRGGDNLEDDGVVDEPPAFQGGSGVVGGDTSILGDGDVSAADAARMAAIMRLSRLEEEKHAHVHDISVKDDEENKVHETETAGVVETKAECEHGCAGHDAPHTQHEHGGRAHVHAQAEEPMEIVSSVQTDVSAHETQRELLQHLQLIWEDMTPLAEASGFDLQNPRIQSTRDGLATLVSSNPPYVVQQSLTTLRTVLGNVLQHGADSSYAKLRKHNKRVHAAILEPSGAETVIRAVGFVDAMNESNDEILVMPPSSADTGLLWFVQSLVERCLELMQ